MHVVPELIEIVPGHSVACHHRLASTCETEFLESQAAQEAAEGSAP